MVKKQNVSVKPFLTRVHIQPTFLDMETLENCVAGLSKRIKLCRSKEKRSKLIMIKGEITALINSL